MKKSKKNYVLIALIVLLLALAVGYAAFSQNLTISGTATGTTTWEVKFVSATINETGHGDSPVVTDNSITVNPLLGFPGDGCTVTANIKNNGSLPAKLTKFNLTAADGTTAFSNSDVTIEIPTIPTDGTEVIAPGATCPVTISIKWNADSTATSVSAPFKVNFEYTQDTTEVNVTPNHGTH